MISTKLDNIDDYTILRSSELLFTGNHFNKEYIKFTNLNENDESNYITIYSLGTDQYKKYIKFIILWTKYTNNDIVRVWALPYSVGGCLQSKY